MSLFNRRPAQPAPRRPQPAGSNFRGTSTQNRNGSSSRSDDDNFPSAFSGGSGDNDRCTDTGGSSDSSDCSGD